jgi:hypothetical protein
VEKLLTSLFRMIPILCVGNASYNSFHMLAFNLARSSIHKLNSELVASLTLDLEPGLGLGALLLFGCTLAGELGALLTLR